MNSIPMVSVLMPVYNVACYLQEAVDSIRKQTFENFEIIAVNDGSTDKSAEILEALAAEDARIKIIHLQENAGIVAALNEGLRHVTGKYIARMDADDISLPERFAKQVAFMEENPEVGVCGSWMDVLADERYIRQMPADHDAIYARMLFSNCMAHNVVFLRTEIFRQHCLQYVSEYRYAEDYDLWSRALPFMRFANLPEPLILYRIHPQNTLSRHRYPQQLARAKIHRRVLVSLGLKPSVWNLYLHDLVGTRQNLALPGYSKHIRAWLDTVELANKEKKLVNHAAMQAELEQRWQAISNKPAYFPAILPFLRDLLTLLKANRTSSVKNSSSF